jgi:hypothetical protein
MAARPRFRTASEYQRRGPVREPYDRILIVCEGQKTEPNYFSSLCFAHKLSSANIRILPSGHASDPYNIVLTAETELKSDSEYAAAYCVFDRDRHANYDRAIAYAANSVMGKANRLRIINSVPCFEVWILLHFQYSTAPFVASGSMSPCDMVIRKLKQNIPNYEKGTKDIYIKTSHHVATAMQHAQRLDRENERSGSTNPATRVHELVAILHDLRK